MTWMIAASLALLVGLFVATIRVTRVATRIETTQRELTLQLAPLRKIAEQVPDHEQRISHLESITTRLSRTVTGSHRAIPEADDAS